MLALARNEHLSLPYWRDQPFHDPEGMKLPGSEAAWEEAVRFVRDIATPMRANIVGPFNSTTKISASIAACLSGTSASVFGRLVM
ncbi:DUF6894 family protein [Bradyrhizobium sp. USDA 10063]